MMFGNAGYAGQPMSPGFAPGIAGLAGAGGFGGYGGYGAGPEAGYFGLPGSTPPTLPVQTTGTQYMHSMSPRTLTPIAKSSIPAISSKQPQTGFGAFKESMGGWGGLAKFGVDTVVGLGELYAASKALELSRDQFDFNKQFAETNLRNQTQTYNTRLEDRAGARAVMEGRSNEDRDAYIAKHRLGGA